MRKLTAVAASLLAALLMVGEVQAATFTEGPTDVGETLGTAAATGILGGDPLTEISGLLATATDADLYLIQITDPSVFSATTVGLDGADTQLFLFTAAGDAVYGNDDDPEGLSLQSTLPSGAASGPLSAGLYYLAVSVAGYDPVNAVSQLLFAIPTLPTDVVGPAAGVSGPLVGFASSFTGSSGAYSILLTGAATAVPEPSSLLALLGAGLVVGRRLRRH